MADGGVRPVEARKTELGKKSEIPMLSDKNGKFISDSASFLLIIVLNMLFMSVQTCLYHRLLEYNLVFMVLITSPW